MSFYQILNIDQDCDKAAISSAAKVCREELQNYCPRHSLASAISYIDSIEFILSSEEGRECYNNFIQCDDSYVSPMRALLILKRLRWFNVHSSVGFGETFLSRLQDISSAVSDTPNLVDSWSEQLKCRWCDEKLDQSEIVSVVCRCDSRCGHSACLERFVSQHGRCPVCRQKLLRRDQLSKYMFFCKDPKYMVR